MTRALVTLHELGPKHHERCVARFDDRPVTNFLVITKTNNMMADAFCCIIYVMNVKLLLQSMQCSVRCAI